MHSVWIFCSYHRPVLLQRLNECIQLNEEYQKQFQRTKEKLRENPNERQFEFSENYIFGKFDTFCKRLEKIADMVNTMEMFSSLHMVKIEGIDTIAVKYKTIVDATKKKNYNILDHRKTEVMTREIIQLEQLGAKSIASWGFFPIFVWKIKRSCIFFLYRITLQNFILVKILFTMQNEMKFDENKSCFEITMFFFLNFSMMWITLSSVVKLMHSEQTSKISWIPGFLGL